jgi:hypothetical protein
VKGLYKTELAILAVVALVLGVGKFHFADDVVQEAIEKEVRPARVLSIPEPGPTHWTVLEPSGIQATFEDCGWARLTINHNPCYSNKPCALRRICYGAARWAL